MRVLFVQGAHAVLLRPACWERHGLKPWIEAAAKRLHRVKLVVQDQHLGPTVFYLECGRTIPAIYDTLFKSSAQTMLTRGRSQAPRREDHTPRSLYELPAVFVDTTSLSFYGEVGRPRVHDDSMLTLVSGSRSSSNLRTSRRHRQPTNAPAVVAKTALATAGAIGGSPGSPTPPGGLSGGNHVHVYRRHLSHRQQGIIAKLSCTILPSRIVTSPLSAAVRP